MPGKEITTDVADWIKSPLYSIEELREYAEEIGMDGYQDYGYQQLCQAIIDTQRKILKAMGLGLVFPS